MTSGSSGRALALLLLLLSSCAPAVVTEREIIRCSVGPEKLPQVERLAAKGFARAGLCAGKLLIKEGKYPEARRFLLKAHEKLTGRKKGEVAYLIGLTFLKEGKRKEAREWFWRATEEGYPNQEFFNLTDYLSLKEVNRLDTLGKKEPHIYLYLGNYFLENGLPGGALFYYQLALRYGIEEARLGSAVCLFKTGNRKLARSILISEYERGNKKAAGILGELLTERASSTGAGQCLVVTEKNPEEFLRKRVSQIKKRAELYLEAYRWFKRAGDEKKARRAYRLYLIYSFKEKGEIPREILSLNREELEKLCREGELRAEFILARRLRSPSAKAAVLLYSRLFK